MKMVHTDKIDLRSSDQSVNVHKIFDALLRRYSSKMSNFHHILCDFNFARKTLDEKEYILKEEVIFHWALEHDYPCVTVTNIQFCSSEDFFTYCVSDQHFIAYVKVILRRGESIELIHYERNEVQ